MLYADQIVQLGIGNSFKIQSVHKKQVASLTFKFFLRAEYIKFGDISLTFK